MPPARPALARHPCRRAGSTRLPLPAHTARLPPPPAVRKDGGRYICCSKTLVAKPDTVDKVAAACAALVAAAGPSPRDGVLEFRVDRDAYDDNVFHFWERYVSNVACGRHNTRADVVEWTRGVVPLLEGPIGMALYEWRDGEGMSMACAQGGPKSEGGLDDAPGGEGMAGGAGLQQTSAAVELGVKEGGGGGAVAEAGAGDGDGGGWRFKLPWQT